MLTERITPKPQAPSLVRHLLIVVDDACSSPDLCASVRHYARTQALEAYVIAPARGTAATQWYVDDDAARAEATQRLRICLNCLSRQGIPASGTLGDPDAVQAIAAALARFPADEIVLVTAPRRPSRWLHKNAIDRARQTFAQPITHVVMPHTSSGGPNARLGDSR